MGKKPDVNQELKEEQHRVVRQTISLLSSSNLAIVVVDFQLKILAFSKRAYSHSLLSISDRLHVGESAPLTKDQTESPLDKAILRALKEEKSQVHTVDLNQADSSLSRYDLGIHPLSCRNQVFAAAIVVSDVSFYAKAEESLTTQLQERQNIINNIEDIVCTLNKEGIVTQINQACHRVLGYTAAEITNRPIVNFLANQEKEQPFFEVGDQIRSGKTIRNINTTFAHKEGRETQLNWTVRFNKQDEIFYCVARDMSEIFRARKKTEDSEKRFRAIFENNPKPIFICSAKTDEIISINSRFKKTFGYGDEIIGTKAAAFLGVAYAPKAGIDKEVMTSLGLEQVHLLRKKNQQPVFGEVSAESVQLESEELTTVIIRDVNDLFSLSREKVLGREFLSMLQSDNELQEKISLIGSLSANFVGSEQHEFWFTDVSDKVATRVSTSSSTGKPVLQASFVYDTAKKFEGIAYGNSNYLLHKTDSLPDKQSMLLIPVSSLEGVVAVIALVEPQNGFDLSQVEYLHSAYLQIGFPLSREIKQNELESIFDLTDDFLITFNENASLKRFSRSLNRILQLGSDDLSGKSLADLIHEVDKPEFKKQLQVLMQGQKVSLSEVRMNKPDGSVMWVSWNFTPVPNRKLFIGAGKDITDKKMLNLKIRESAERLHNITSAITDGFFALDKNYKIIYWNDIAVKTFRYIRNKALGKHISEVLDPERYNILLKLCKEARNIRKPKHFEYLYNRSWYLISVFASADGFSIFFREITQEKEQQEALRISNERYENVMHATEEAIWDYDLESGQIAMSEAYFRKFNYPVKAFVSLEEIKTHMHQEDEKTVLDGLDEILSSADRNNWEVEYRLISGDNKVAHVLNRAYVVRDASLRPIKVIGSIQDITERKKTQKLLEELYTSLEQRAKELEVSNQELEEFAYIVSHDLQQPLRMTEGLLTMLKTRYEDKLDHTGRELIDHSIASAVKMKTLTNDLLQFSRLGTEKKNFIATDLNEVLKTVFTMYKSELTALDADVQTSPMPTLRVLPNQLEQLFQNLIGNAIKYKSEHRTLSIHIEAKEFPSYWQFAVKDNGIGIEPKHFKKIFSIFQRLHHSSEYPGTGIGLSFCKKIVERHNGEIWLESTPDEGSTFFFTLSKTL